jgi:glycosyltransferase involved in cell wall biosynthesis
VTLRLGIAGTLPGIDTGPADNLGYVIQGIAPLCDLTCYVPDLNEVTAEIRATHRVLPISEIRAEDTDVLIYQVANNPQQEPVNEASRTGPPGLLEIHDGSQHHLLAHLTQERGKLEEYRRAMELAHGEAGARLADLRGIGPGFQLEHVVFDNLLPLLRRHRGAIVHNRWAAGLVERRLPGMPTFMAPVAAPPPRVPGPVNRAALGLPEDAFVIANIGFVTHPKRPLLLFDAFAEVCRQGVNAFLVFGGEIREGFGEALADRAERAGLTGRMLLTGYLERQRLDALLDAVDVVFNCRFPQLGESSGVMAESMAAGRPLIVHPLGAWADVPDDAVIKVDMGRPEEEVAAVAGALLRLRDPGLRARLGAAAQRYASEELSVEVTAAAVVAAAEATIKRRLQPMEARLAAAAERAAAALEHVDDLAARALFEELPPALDARPLLLLGSPGWGGVIADGLGYAVVAEEAPAGGCLPAPAGRFAVVVTSSAEVLAAGDAGALLAEVNRVLDETGCCFIAVDDADRAAVEALLLATGFGQLSRGLGVVGARKVALPAGPAPGYPGARVEAPASA